MPLLTKSKYLTALQCSKYLWITFNDKTKIPPTDASTQFVFDQGNEVGGYAKRLFPDGIDVPYVDFRGSVARTKSLLTQRTTLFEASILAGDFYSRIDILQPVDQEAWDIIEVKSTTSVKDEHIWDAAFQRYCCEKAGVKIRRCYLMHLNNQYVKDGGLDLNALFHREDISAQVEAVYGEIPAKIDEIFKTIAQKVSPVITIGMHCLQPYECPLKSYCWAFLPKRSIFTLYYLGKEKKFELLKQGIKTIEDLPADYELTDKQQIQKRVITDNSVHVDHGEIAAFLQTLQYPLYYLDFETFSPAIPLYDGTRPYQRIPFQYSLHVVKEPGGAIEHCSFLADGVSDPRQAFLSSLKAVMGTKGSVVVYNQMFEEGVLKELAEAFPEHGTWIQPVINRMVDLLMPFRAFHYHHPDQNGSASLKNVLPVLTGQTYKDMNIQEGDEASRTFVETFIKGTSTKDKATVRKDLEDYCRLDTQAMVDVVGKLKEMVAK